MLAVAVAVGEAQDQVGWTAVSVIVDQREKVVDLALFLDP